MAIATPLRRELFANPQLEAFLDAVTDAVILIGEEGRIQISNRVAERMFGYAKEELLGQDAGMLVPERYRPRLQVYLGRHLRPGRRPAVIHELQAQRRDGAHFAVEVGVNYIHGIDTPHLIAFVRDVGERKRNEDLMRYSEAALHLTQELANIGNYVIHHADGGLDYASPQLRRIFGWEADEPVKGLARYVESVVHWSDRQRVAQAFAHLDAGGGAFHIEYRINHPTTGLRYLHHMAQSIYDAENRVLEHVGAVHDITERRVAEHEIRQMHDRIVHFGRISTMGEMAAAIAHEVNQPLTAITAFAQSCERLLSNETFLREELATSLRQIAMQALRAGKIIRRVRAFSKVREMHFECVEANRIMEELLVLAQTDAHHHNVRLSFIGAPHLPAVRVDTVQIQQVLLNLVRNGIEAMTDVKDSQREILLKAQLLPGEVQFIVEDRGRGIDPKFLDDIFQPFFTTKPSGTGLGLAISASIVREHGGKLKCENNPDGGARFSFALPVATKIDFRDACRPNSV